MQSTAAPFPYKPVGSREWIGFLSMVLGMFMAILDIQIVASSLNEIRAGLSASIEEIGWVQTAYLIAEVIMIPLSGTLSRIFSTRRFFAFCSFGFTVMSLGCALSWDLGSLIFFRTCQGFIGGALIPTVFATSFTLFPQEKRAAVGVIIGLVATMAPTLGPTVGGYITQFASWHWLFLVNLLPGFFITVMVLTFIHVDEPQPHLKKSFDWWGTGFMALFLGCLQYILEEGPSHDWLDDSKIAFFSTITILSGLAFFIRVFRTSHPIVDLRAFLDRNYAIGCAYSFCLGVGLYGAVYLTPLFLARVRGFNSLQIGLIMAVTGAAQFLSAPLAGILSKKMDLRLMLLSGILLFFYGIYLNAELTSDAAFWEFFWPQAVRGISLMLCFVPINELALGTLPLDRLKNASGLYNLMRNLGGAFGLAYLNTLIIERGVLHLTRLSENLTAARPAVTDFLEKLTAYMGDTIRGDPEQGALKMLYQMTKREALTLTFNDCFYIVAGLFLASAFLMPLIRKPKRMVEAAH